MQDTKVKTKALDKGNCSTARLGGEEAGVKTTSLRTGTGCEAGDADECARQHEVHEVSASQVKPGVVSGKITSLPGEACPPRGGACERVRSTVRGNTIGERAGVSRGHSSCCNEPLERTEASQNSEGLNIKLFQMLHGVKPTAMH